MTKSNAFDPSTLPDLTGFIALVTGGHSGLGLATAIHLCSLHAKVYIASRSRTKAEVAVEQIKEKLPDALAEVLEMDLADLGSVKRGAKEFLGKESQLHILVNNAGVMCVPYSETPQGIEIQFATNYLSHFYLTQLLLPALISTAAAFPSKTVRIVNVSSDGHAKLAPKNGIDFDDVNLSQARCGHDMGIRNLRKSCMPKRLRDGMGRTILLLNLAQGARTSTPLYRLIQPLVELGAPGPEKGSWNSLWCAVSPDLESEQNGCYFMPVGKTTKASECGENPEMAARLWAWSEEKVKEFGL